MGDEGSKRGTIKSVEEILSHGGCKVANTVHENGHEWHPILPSHGEQKCIKCRCKVSVNDFLKKIMNKILNYLNFSINSRIRS